MIPRCFTVSFLRQIADSTPFQFYQATVSVLRARNHSSMRLVAFLSSIPTGNHHHYTPQGCLDFRFAHNTTLPFHTCSTSLGHLVLFAFYWNKWGKIAFVLYLSSNCVLVGISTTHTDCFLLKTVLVIGLCFSRNPIPVSTQGWWIGCRCILPKPYALNSMGICFLLLH